MTVRPRSSQFPLLLFLMPGTQSSIGGRRVEGQGRVAWELSTGEMRAQPDATNEPTEWNQQLRGA